MNAPTNSSITDRPAGQRDVTSFLGVVRARLLDASNMHVFLTPIVTNRAQFLAYLPSALPNLQPHFPPFLTFAVFLLYTSIASLVASIVTLPR
jgi:hypothetical protein